jgi:hypothetical protein
MEKGGMSGGFAGGWRFEKRGARKNVSHRKAAREKVIRFTDLPLKKWYPRWHLLMQYFVMMIFRMIKNLFRRPPIRMGRVDDARIQRTSIRNAGFVSFMTENRCYPRRGSDRHEARLRRLRLARMVAYFALGTGGAWVVVESVRALALF